MATRSLALTELRGLIQQSWEQTLAWLAAKPRVLELPRPDQQLTFELACRLRQALRAGTENPAWDRLLFDTSACVLGPAAVASTVGRRPPIYVDARQLFASGGRSRSALEPDAALAVGVLRSCSEIVDFDDDGVPRHQAYLPVTLQEQGWLIEEHVRQLERQAKDACDGYLFVVYSNPAGRRTAVDLREVASWASWQKVHDSLWWASRHFRAK
jgi:hypothetical protein